MTPRIETHYVYMTTDNVRYYIGVRTCKGNIEQDDYMGSHIDSTYTPKDKKVLAIGNDRIDAERIELYYQKLFNVVQNPLFVNQVYNFHSDTPRLGAVLTTETKNLISSKLKGVKHTLERRKNRSKRMKENPDRYFIPTRKGMNDKKETLYQKHLSNRDNRVHIFVKDEVKFYLQRHDVKNVLGISVSSCASLINRYKKMVKGFTYAGYCPFNIVEVHDA